MQRGLDSPYKREIQRLLGVVRLISEMYNYAAVSSALIFDLLYHLINFGHETHLSTGHSYIFCELFLHNFYFYFLLSKDSSVAGSSASPVKYDPRIPSEVDPFSDLFRAQLVCEVLNSCGQYYVRGHGKDKLTRFLTYFQRYLLTKQYVPLHIEFCILDTLDNLEELAR